MLTRAQARTKECPYRIAAFLRPDEHPAKEWFLCTANDCPKWVDIDGDGKLNPFCGNGTNVGQQEHCTVSGNCNDCPHRYGRCGG